MIEKPEPDYIVIRGTGHDNTDGTWVDRVEVGRGAKRFKVPVYDGSVIEICPTGEFETREDGAVAEVWAPREQEGL